MPKRNAIKLYLPNAYYHIYMRANNKAAIFNSDATSSFLGIIKLLLSTTPQLDERNRPQANYSSQLELLAFAIMPNHFHLLIFQYDEHAMEKFMRSLMIRFATAYNKQYSHTGRVFESSYLAKLITSDPQLYHSSRYIHLNPPNWQTGKNTSLNYYSGKYHADWIKPDKILQLFPSYDSYLEFLKSFSTQS